MPDNDETSEPQSDARISRFIMKLGNIDDREDRSAEALIVIAIELMQLNAHMQALHGAVSRITDR